ncbi:MAG: alpha-L-fucosidase [Paludibacter sp.]|nr:alpha-L-fucosidase [Paludibacter sp.]
MKSKKYQVYLLTGLLLCIQFPVQSQSIANDNTQWFSDARFGMFIHWGLYSIPAGMWDGKSTPDKRYINPYAEHIMLLNKIPLKEYSKLCNDFNPVGFDADKIVKMAKNAGMKYIVFTAKHHEGFAMYKSEHPYNIFDATPYKKDPIEMLAKACKKEGVKLGIYYSLGRDWQDSNAVCGDWRRNTWDFPDTKGLDYQKYIDLKVKPQIKELLTNYGEIALIWFDTPELTTLAQSKDLEEYVKSIQPHCLVNSRIGNDLGDILEMEDNEIPADKETRPWETPGTMAESFGYSILDTKEYWKSSEELIRKLVEITAKGGNYLLNVGPDGNGVLPDLAINRLNDFAKWMKVNKEAIQGTKPYSLNRKEYRGYFTEKGNVLYVHLFDSPENHVLSLNIDPSTIVKVELLEENGPKKLSYSATYGQGIIINLPKELPFKSVSVIKISRK